MSGGPADRAPRNQDLDPIGETGADVGTKPDCPSAEGSDNMSVTNSEVESAMNHRRCKAVLRDPKFSDEAFNAFSSGDAYIRAARDELRRATKKYPDRCAGKFSLSKKDNHMPVAPEIESSWHN